MASARIISCLSDDLWINLMVVIKSHEASLRSDLTIHFPLRGIIKYEVFLLSYLFNNNYLIILNMVVLIIKVTQFYLSSMIFTRHSIQFHLDLTSLFDTV